MDDRRIEVRPARREDAPVLAEMTREFERYLSELAEEGQGDPVPKQTEETFLALAFGDDPCFSCEMALIDGQAAGFISHFIGYDADYGLRTLFLPDVFVRAPARGRGVGRALMTAAARIARARGAGLIRWTVWRRNEAAIAFYRRLGAKPQPEELPTWWLEEAWPPPE